MFQRHKLRAQLRSHRPVASRKPLIFAKSQQPEEHRRQGRQDQRQFNGAPGQLTAQVQAVNSAGVFMDSGGRFGGSIATGDVNYFYQGTLISQANRYTFTGTNGFADFVDLSNNTRFRVQMIVQGAQLLMIIEGPGREQYPCQMVGQR